METKIKCISCRFAKQDKNATTYSRKRCAACDNREECDVCQGCDKRENCKARQKPTYKQSCDRRADMVCSRQTLNWAAIQCTNPDSEFHRCLLNITPSGDKQYRVTWGGCPCGERGERS